MKKLLLIPVLCILISCRPNSGKNSTNETTSNNTRATDSKKSTIKIKKDNILEKSPEKLIGIWADSVGGNAVFQIEKKTFFYPDNNAGYNYKFIGDSIQVHYDGYYQSFAWKFKGNDTLVLTGRDGITPFYRMKE
ncbi:hypothetical protein [Mucilaginibacter flavidus]|uniref:hypothetical protein n=1 Tax=Mucilaginibacter flavidus TaxID=2949309 RepID=UPI00209225A0|nr:hypothetical protein [Mucilaginibacter flavidus]MCO5951104.1 hypothetical protein [Mucilaginibacter flavidus]